MSTNPFPYVIVSGYKTNRQEHYTNDSGIAWTHDRLLSPWRARTLAIAEFVANEIGARRKRLAIVKNFGTKHERVVWERNR